MIDVKQPCHCGGKGVLEQTGAKWHVRCDSCGSTPDGAWVTMTVAIFDWEDFQKVILVHKGRFQKCP